MTNDFKRNFLLLPTTQQTSKREKGNVISNLVHNFARIEVIHDKVFFFFF